MKSKIIIEGKTFNQMKDFNRNEHGFKISFELLNENNSVVDITGKTIKFKVKQVNTTTNKVSGLCNITDATNGKCEYEVVDVDFDTNGIFDSEIELVDSTSELSVKLGRFKINEDLP